MAEVITDDTERRRFELHVEGELAALVTYGRNDEMLALTHTETEPGFEGKGYAKKIVAHVIGVAQENDLAVLPFCPFVKHYMLERPELLALVPERYRANFGLVGAGS